MPELEWAEAARADLLAIVDYISDENPDAAQRLKADIDTKTANLPEHPRLYRQGRIEGTREMVVWSNFIVVYQEMLWLCAFCVCYMLLSNGRRVKILPSVLLFRMAF